MSLNMPVLLEWFRYHHLITWWLGSISVFMLLGFLLAIPVLILRLPTDYFLNQATPNHNTLKTLSISRLVYVVLKNILGIVFLLAGIALLFLPGQGILTILIGISLLNIPGKHHLFLVILQQKNILQSMNKLRIRFNKPVFLTHP